MAKSDKSKISAAFHEVFHNKPKTVDTSKSAEGQRKQMVAISLSKARAAGAKIPKMHSGGIVPVTGPYELEKGEKVIPSSEAAVVTPSKEEGALLPNMKHEFSAVPYGLVKP
jgi:hypothetical protein